MILICFSILIYSTYKFINLCNPFWFEATTPMRNKRKDGFLLKGYEDLVVIGMSVCWGAKDAYFVSLQQELSDTGMKHVIENLWTKD